MTEEQLDHAVGIYALSASTVMCRALRNEKRFKSVRFHVSDADQVELREYLKAWALAKRTDA